MNIVIPPEALAFFGVWLCGVIFGAVAALVIYIGSSNPWPI